jgi:predicted HAD superfamily Cof-like phosphohydrolase
VSTSIFHDQEEFLKAGDSPQFTLRAEILAIALVEEEFWELEGEHLYLQEDSSCNAIKEALDLMYVTAQYLNVTVGADKAKELWDALHENNMSKCVEGKLVKSEQGKILKPEGYVPLDIEKLL